MIFTSGINLILLIVNNVLDMIPVIEIAISGEYINGFLGFLNFCTYLFPFYALVPIFTTIIALNLFRIFISVLKTIWGILPVV